MELVKRWTQNRNYVKYLLIGLIFIYPLAGAFLGMDLGDTGYHLYAYRNLLTHPEKLNYTTFFSSVIGYCWGTAFDWMGLLAYNLLEVFLEWILVWIVYETLKEELGEITVLAGGLFAVICADTYLNIFNYHQLNAFLLTAVLCLEYKAMTEGRRKMSFWAGVLYALVVFSRVGSVVALITCALYIYHGVMNDFSWKEAGSHLALFAAGTAAMGAAAVLCLLATGRLDYFINNIFRLGGIASDSSTAYGFKNLLESLIKDNLKVIESGLLFYGGALILSFGLNIGLRECRDILKKLCHILLGCFVGGVALCQMYFAYNVNPAEEWPQMTTGQRFILGVMYVTAFLCFMYHGFKKDRHSQRISLLVIAACMLLILTIAGSNTGTKHVILAMWLMAPVCVYTVRTLLLSEETVRFAGWITEKTGLSMHRYTLRAVAVAAFVLFFYKFGHMVYFTFNYDDVNRLKLTATVDNDKVRGIFTTQRQADALNGVLTVLKQHNEEQPLMMFGNSLLFFYMTGREAYGMPWVTQNTYPLERYQEDVEKAAEEFGDTLPVVIYCRTNYAYGFGEERLSLSQWETTASLNSGKKQFFMDFLKEHDYGLEYINDYYAVIAPEQTEDFTPLEKVIFGQ